MQAVCIWRYAMNLHFLNLALTVSKWYIISPNKTLLPLFAYSLVKLIFYSYFALLCVWTLHQDRSLLSPISSDTYNYEGLYFV